MPLYVIERTVPGAGELSRAQLGEIARTSCTAVTQVGSPYDWKQTYVTDEKFFCVHEAVSEEACRRHAELGGFPVDRVYEVKNIFDASTGEE